MDGIGIFELVLTVAGFAIAIWQLHKTRKAAEAARSAAGEAVKSIRHVEAVANIQQICGRSRDLLHLARARNLPSAANAAFELRDAVSRYQPNSNGVSAVNSEIWTKTIADTAIVHDRLESASVTNRLDLKEREVLIHEIGRLHAVFATLASTTSILATDGVTNANP